MQKKYNKAYKEVIEILKYMSKEEREKIPIKMIKMFEEKMDKDYSFKYDETKSFEEQELLIETKAILANIFRDYWATPEQKARIVAKQNYDRKKAEEQKKERFNPENIFKKQNSVEQKEETKNEVAMIEYKKSIFNTFISKIKKFFNRVKGI